MINIKVDPKGLEQTGRLLKAIELNIKPITKTALNATLMGSKNIQGSEGNSIKDALKGASKGFLDKPKKAVQDAWFDKQYARANNLEAVIDLKDKPFKRYRYIAPHIFGFARYQKKGEARLLNHPMAGDIPKDSRLVPHVKNIKGVTGVNLDSYGNVSAKSWDYIYKHVATSKRTAYRSVLKHKDLEPEKREKSSRSFLVGTPKYKSRAPGVWSRSNNNKKLINVFTAVSKADYDEIYHAEKVMRKVIDRRWAKYFESSWKRHVNPWLY